MFLFYMYHFVFQDLFPKSELMRIEFFQNRFLKSEECASLKNGIIKVIPSSVSFGNSFLSFYSMNNPMVIFSFKNNETDTK